jgi:hypothetical protein
VSVGNGKGDTAGTVEVVGTVAVEPDAQVGAGVQVGGNVEAGWDGCVGGGGVGWVGGIFPGFSDLSPCNVSGLQAELDSPSACPFLLVDC